MGALGPREGEHLVDRGVAVIAGALTELDEVSLIGLDQTATAASLVEIAAAEAEHAPSSSHARKLSSSL